ncbi:hypothetical protein N7495_007568 [Penicillium taxi]|uniref:uncharacterized protein n=1 Tax=Penicillium taxi TaxID=168475 RepID=UPI002544F4F9|nr:uncharacterized protein N7495_007568 [Penicillium taxi]KAJ5887527.1 hypothetical protein N7495_007568 [Penicillium taxi]
MGLEILPSSFALQSPVLTSLLDQGEELFLVRYRGLLDSSGFRTFVISKNIPVPVSIVEAKVNPLWWEINPVVGYIAFSGSFYALTGPEGFKRIIPAETMVNSVQDREDLIERFVDEYVLVTFSMGLQGYYDFLQRNLSMKP